MQNDHCPLHLKQLKHPLSKCGPESKFFLVKMLALHPNHAGFVKTQSELIKESGLSSRILGRALTELVKANYLLQTPANGKGAGRKLTQYTFNVEDALNQLPPFSPTNHQRILIEELLNTAPLNEDEKEATQKTIHPLNISHKLLLMTLLAHTQESFTVKNLGVAQLVKLTGMRTERLRSQLEFLTRHKNQYIRRIVSGITGRFIFGSQPSIYFLNPNPGRLGDRHPLSVINLIVNNRAAQLYGALDQEAHMMYALAFSYGAKLHPIARPVPPPFKTETHQLTIYSEIVKPEPYLKYAHHLLRDSDPQVENYLQAFIVSWSGTLLCQFPTDFYNAAKINRESKIHINPKIEEDKIIKSMSSQLFDNIKSSERKHFTDEINERIQKENLVKWILNISIKIASDAAIDMINNNINLKLIHAQFYTRKINLTDKHIALWSMEI
jgi:hypothetical protein